MPTLRKQNKCPFKKCQIVPKKVKRWTLLGLLTYNPLQNIKKKTLKGGPSGTLKKFSKNTRNVEKIERGYLLVSAEFVGYGKLANN